MGAQPVAGTEAWPRVSPPSVCLKQAAAHSQRLDAHYHLSFSRLPAGEAAAPAAQPQEGKRGWGDRVRHRLAKMGIGDEAHAAAVEYEPPPTVTQLGPADAALSGGRLGPVAEESGGSFTQGHPPDAGHLGPEAGGGIDSGAQQGGGQAVRRKITGGLQAVGRGLSKVRSRGLVRQEAATGY